MGGVKGKCLEYGFIVILTLINVNVASAFPADLSSSPFHPFIVSSFSTLAKDFYSILEWEELECPSGFITLVR